MAQETLSKEYFDWMCNLVCDSSMPYEKLLTRLHEIEFVPIMPMDDNRAADGVDFRYRFAYENRYHPAIIAEYIDNRPCSVLEMMVALIHRFEEQIMDNQEFGNQSQRWFMEMITSLGLKRMTDTMYDEMFVDRAIMRFHNRDYKPNGEGGLFTVQRYRRDMRLVDIWYQMCWYLDEVLERR